MKLDFTIDQEDLKVLRVHTLEIDKHLSFEQWTQKVKESYTEYHIRNSNNLERYGVPKTFSQWVNGQIIALT